MWLLGVYFYCTFLLPVHFTCHFVPQQVSIFHHSFQFKINFKFDYFASIWPPYYLGTMCKRKYLQEHWSLAGHLAAKSPSLWEPTFTPNPVSCLLTHCKSMKNILALWEFYFFQGQGWETFSKYFYMYTTGSSASPVCISSIKDKFYYFTTFTLKKLF